MKKIIIILIILVAVGAVLFFGKSSLFTGNLNSRLAFFKESPSKDQVVEGAFITYQEAASLLTFAALKAKRIDDVKAASFIQQFASSQKISRAALADMAVKIFGLTYPAANTTKVSDVATNDPYFYAIMTCVANGCMDIEFKPNNLTMRQFAEKMGQNLSGKLSGNN